jgi:hypothetical protein
MLKERRTLRKALNNLLDHRTAEEKQAGADAPDPSTTVTASGVQHSLTPAAAQPAKYRPQGMH